MQSTYASRPHGGVSLQAVAVLIILGVFLVDVTTSLEGAVAVLYVVVVLIAARAFDRRAVVLTSLGCLALTLTAYMISHGPTKVDAALVRCFVSLAAIGITTALALRHKADASVLAEQAHLLALTHDAVFVRDSRDVITFWNRAAEEFYGWAADEVVGRVAHEVLQTDFRGEHETIQAKLRDTGRWEGELVQRLRDGHTVVVESRWALQCDAAGTPVGVLETNTDVTDRKRTYAQLVESERRYRTIFDNTQVPILQQDWSRVGLMLDRLRAQGVTDIVGHFQRCPTLLKEARRAVGIVDVNAVTGRLLGITNHAALSKTLDDLLPEADEAFLRALVALDSGERFFEGETTIRGRDETMVPVLFGVSFPEDRTGLGCVLVHAVDITERKAAAAALLTAQADLAHASRVSTMGELAATMAHEINQPLAAIVASGEAALRWLDRPAPELGKAVEALNRAIASGRRASDILARIRGFLAKTPPRRELIDLAEMIGEANQLVEREMRRHDVTLRTAFPPDLPEVFGDRVQLQQVIINLMVNGIQAMAELEGRPRLLRVRAQIVDDAVRVEVADNGEGIGPDAMGRVFQPFFTTKGNGMGMGLAICRSTVEAHGGRLGVMNGEPGAIFYLTLPAGREASGAMALPTRQLEAELTSPSS